MARPPKVSITIADFQGLLDNADPRDTPPGAAQVQTNLTCLRSGELQVRLGFSVVTFES